jgi:two-component system sensor histidine kinase EvgS
MKSGISVLLVDDQPSVRRAFKHLLDRAGHAAEAVESGESALSLLARRDFDVVITDSSMPDMQGDKLAPRIRALLPAQRIIMATAFVEEYEVFGQPFGNVDAVLLKPFTFQDLKETIERVLALEKPACSPAEMPPHIGLPLQIDDSVNHLGQRRFISP